MLNQRIPPYPTLDFAPWLKCQGCLWWEKCLFSAAVEPDVFDPGEHNSAEVPAVCPGFHEDHVWQQRELPAVGHRSPGLRWDYSRVRGTWDSREHSTLSEDSLVLSLCDCWCPAYEHYFPQQGLRPALCWVPHSSQGILVRNTRRCLLQLWQRVTRCCRFSELKWLPVKFLVYILLLKYFLYKNVIRLFSFLILYICLF